MQLSIDEFEGDIETVYLADSQFDFPNSSTGWQYKTLDVNNQFGGFKPREQSRLTATPFAFLVCDDPHSFIGRDFVHPGYQCRPTLQWNAPQEGKYLLQGEVAFLRSTASGNFYVSIFVDDVRVLSQTLHYPENLEFAIPVKAKSFIRIVFTCLKTIDNNHCFYAARIKKIDDASEVVSVENQGGFSRVQEAPALTVLKKTLQEIVPVPMNDQQVAELTLNPFEQFRLLGQNEINIYSDRLRKDRFGYLQEQFHLPRYFSEKTKS